MATVIGIMDREGWDQRTDIIVVIRPEKNEVLWVPRDLYCESLGNRINMAFRMGGHELLQTALREHGISVEHGICVLRSVVEKAFLDLSIEVPVEEAQEFYYPLSPQMPIEEGRKIVRFDPPKELLHGERFHQWMGARTPLTGSFDASGDLVRIRRQQILLKRLLEENFSFNNLTSEGLDISSSSAWEEAKLVRPDWKFHTLTGLEAVTLYKMYVFIRNTNSEEKLLENPQLC